MRYRQLERGRCSGSNRRKLSADAELSARRARTPGRTAAGAAALTGGFNPNRAPSFLIGRRLHSSGSATRVLAVPAAAVRSGDLLSLTPHRDRLSRNPPPDRPGKPLRAPWFRSLPDEPPV